MDTETAARRLAEAFAQEPRVRWIDIQSTAAVLAGRAPARPRWHVWLDDALETIDRLLWAAVEAIPFVATAVACVAVVVLIAR